MSQQAYTVASDSETTGDDRHFSAAFEPAIGLDIGTSRCSVAVWDGARVELLRNPRNQKMMRSYVMFSHESPSGGVSDEFAHDEQEILSGRAVFNVKRLVGRTDTDPVVHSSKTLPFLVQTMDIGVRPFIAALVNGVWRSTTPEEVLAIFLVELRAMVEVQFKRDVRNVVLTVPVSFSRFQQTRMERACAMAGLHVLRLMPEPTAVALIYAQQQQQAMQGNVGSGSEKVALIFNMGAGYCDVAVTATAGGVSQIKALSGATIGGDDILQNAMRYFVPDLDSFYSGHGIDEIKAMGFLRVASQNAIHALSSHTSTMMDVDMGKRPRLTRSFTRDEFEAINREVFEKCESLVKQCLHDSKLLPEDINDVVLVGGCSQIPTIRSMVLNLCKHTSPYKGIHPLEAAVSGAALEGAVASGITDPFGNLDLLTIQATPFSLGIQVDGTNFEPIVQRNATIPARKEMIFTTMHDNQTQALVIVYEGEAKQVEGNHLLGFFKVGGIPLAQKGLLESACAWMWMHQTYCECLPE
uniref:Heat shock 70 kDa protein 8 n=1 Tax=Nymphaea colorata TaxID=210225 RepID=A0A5K1EMB4_9MAGN